MRTLVFDIDDVLCPTVPCLLAWHNARYGTSHVPKDITSYKIYTVWGVPQEEGRRRLTDFEHSEEFHALKPSSEAQRAVSLLSKEYRLVASTHRRVEHRDMTARLLNEFGTAFSDLFMTGRARQAPATHTKAQLVQHVDAMACIDDALEHIEHYAEAGMRAIVFGDYAWNDGPIPAQAVRAATFYHVLQEIGRPDLALEYVSR